MSGKEKIFDRLVELSRYLRGPNGCPWDREQTAKSLRSNVIEEAYEVVEAIDRDNPHELAEELGDLLYQVVFLSQIEEENSRFNVYDVVERLHNKLIRRHPHVFGEKKARDSAEALGAWNQQKLKEKQDKAKFHGIPRSMPALMRAERIGKQASQAGFDWENAGQVIEKVREELHELEAEIEKSDKEGCRKEWGDLLLSVVSLGRHLGLDTEKSAHSAADSFIERFSKMEKKAEQQGRKLSEMSSADMNTLWDEIKRLS